MLLTLAISNFILIDKLSLEFKAGLSVITGETGAGKSIIIDALMLVLGERLSGKYHRDHSKQVDLTAEFDVTDNEVIKGLLVENEIPLAESLVIRRVISIDGKSKAFVNDSLVSLGFVQKLAKQLVEVANQHEHQALLRPELQLSILDQYAKHDLVELKAKYHELTAVHNQYNEMLNCYTTAKQERSYLQYVQEELTALAPVVGEEEELLAKRKLLAERHKIIESLQIACAELGGEKGALSKIHSATRAASKVSDMVGAHLESLEKVTSELEEIVAVFEELGSTAASSTENIDAVEGRLSVLRDASRKYGVEISGLLGYLAEVESKLSLINDNSKVLETLSEQVEGAKAAYLNTAQAIQKSRKEAAGKLKTAVETELAQLKMAETAVFIDFTEKDEGSWGELGIDRVAFKISTNPGLPFECISKAASGGELSRLMLGFKVIISGINAPVITIFDEVDVGVGGAVADSIGRKLARLAIPAAANSKATQVLSITHHPQVAVHADNHYMVQKRPGSHGNTVSVELLSADERCQEIARMLSGEMITPASLEAAKTMLAASVKAA